jgi:single-strand DNA-binding protein
MYQQITLIGNLGSDPDMRYTPSGVPYASFSLAVNKSWTNQEGQRQDKTTWFRITVWRKQAETVSQYLTKGSKALIVGELEEARIYTDRDGNNRVSLDVTANTVRFLSGRGEGAASGGGNYASEPAGMGASGGANSGNRGGEDLSDEEIPF